MLFWDFREAVFYQVYPASFKESPPPGSDPDKYDYKGVGNLNGIIASLDYLQHDLGVDAIWVSPHYESPERDMVRMGMAPETYEPSRLIFLRTAAGIRHLKLSKHQQQVWDVGRLRPPH